MKCGTGCMSVARTQKRPPSSMAQRCASRGRSPCQSHQCASIDAGAKRRRASTRSRSPPKESRSSMIRNGAPQSPAWAQAHGTVVLNATAASPITPITRVSIATIRSALGSSTTIRERDGIRHSRLPRRHWERPIGQNIRKRCTTGTGRRPPSPRPPPGGLHFSTDGVLSAFARPGTFAFTVSARFRHAPRRLANLMDIGPSFITPTSLPSAAINAPYSTS